MRKRTLGVVFVLLLALSSVAAFGFVQIAESDGALTERWVTDTAREAIGNHHAPTAARIGPETTVLAPVNAPRKAGNCALVALDGGREERWRANVPPEDCNIHAFGNPTVADLDGDGNDEVFVATTESVVHAYDVRTGREEFRRNLSGWGYNAPVVTDFAPSPGRELVVTDLSGGVFVYDSDGTQLWNRSLSGVIAPIFVEDFDADGTPELAVGDGKNVTVMERDGTLARETPVGGSVTWLTVGRADADAGVEIVASTIDGRVVGVDGKTGETEWTRRFDAMASVYAFGDGDGDGQTEVYAAARDGKLRAIDASDGSIEWTTTLTTADVQTTPPPALGDLDGDAEPELVAVSQDGVVSVVNPKTGAVVDSYERDVPIWMRPTLEDLDDDGELEIMVVYGDGRVAGLSYGDE